jgi:hypothetical protein
MPGWGGFVNPMKSKQQIALAANRRFGPKSRSAKSQAGCDSHEHEFSERGPRAPFALPFPLGYSFAARIGNPLIDHWAS